MKESSFKALVLKYISLNFFILAALFAFVPMYPWWFFAGIGGVMKIYQLSLGE